MSLKSDESADFVNYDTLYLIRPNSEENGKALDWYNNKKGLVFIAKYGECKVCELQLEPVWFEEKECKQGYPTGRPRQTVDYLICSVCLNKMCVDDIFNKP